MRKPKKTILEFIPRPVPSGAKTFSGTANSPYKSDAKISFLRIFGGESC